MKILSPRVHGVLDYVVVLVLLAAPRLFGLSGVPALLSYALSAVHLAVTLTTDFPLGALRLLPLRVHGWIELVVGPTLFAAAWTPPFAAASSAHVFYAAAGVAIFLTWAITDYAG